MILYDVICGDIFDILYRMKRTSEVQAAYNAFRTRVLREWPSIDDYIRTVKFQGGVDMAFEPNPFPYKGLGLRHWILWSIRPLKNREIHTFLEGLPPYRIQINKKNEQSVPDVWHAHVIFDS